MDPVWGYEAVNVEAQQSDQSSLLNWMRNMIALRKLFRVFGRGTLNFLEPANRKILAYLREFNGEVVLCVANLSRFAQPVQLDLAALEGMIPVEMLGYVEFPPIDKTPYALTLGPYGFLWLELQGVRHGSEPVHEISESGGELEVSLSGEKDWKGLFSGRTLTHLEKTLLPEFLARQRWFGGKSRHIAAASVVDWGTFDEQRCALALLRVAYEEGEPDIYLVPLSMSQGAASAEIQSKRPNAVLASVKLPEGVGVLHDGLSSEQTPSSLLALIAESGTIKMAHGVIHGLPSSLLISILGDGVYPGAQISSAEQSNSSIIYGDKLMMKLFRRQQAGVNPDTEIGRYLTEQTSFRNVAPFGGSIRYVAGSDTYTFAMLQGLVANEGDGWQWTLEQLDRYFEDCSGEVFPAADATSLPTDFLSLSETALSERVRDSAGIYLDAAATLGRRTGELHVALGQETADEDFRPRPFTAEDSQALREQLSSNAGRAFEALKDSLATLPDELVESAALVLSRRKTLFEKLSGLTKKEIGGLQTRVHGDYHLGQVLRTKSDFVILDFEGEPAKLLAERRAKQSPLKDVAGMLRSFSYAAYAALNRYTTRRPQSSGQLEPWARLWEQAVTAEFLRAYRESVAHSSIVPGDRAAFQSLLEAYVLDKALYELVYELNNRPAWVRIPLHGILSLTL